MNAETLIAKNNCTVSHIEGKDFASALRASVEALSYQKAIVDSYPKVADKAEPVNVLDRRILCSQDCEEGTHDIKGKTYFIYDKGISLTPNALANHDDASAILIFNTALAHQLYASATLYSQPSASELLLVKAKSLYELAFKLHPVRNGAGLFQSEGRGEVGSDCGSSQRQRQDERHSGRVRYEGL